MGNSIDESEASKSSDTSHSQTGQSRSQSQSTTSSCTSETTTTNSEASASSSTYTTTRSRSQSADCSTECYTSSTEDSDKVTQKPRHETISEVDDVDHDNQELGEDDNNDKMEIESDEESLVKVEPPSLAPVHRSPTPPELIQVSWLTCILDFFLLYIVCRPSNSANILPLIYDYTYRNFAILTVSCMSFYLPSYSSFYILCFLSSNVHVIAHLLHSVIFLLYYCSVPIKIRKK